MGCAPPDAFRLVLDTLDEWMGRRDVFSSPRVGIFSLSKPILQSRVLTSPTDPGPPAGSFISLAELVFRLLSVIFLFMGPGHPAILLGSSIVLLGGAFSTHWPMKSRQGESKGSNDNTTGTTPGGVNGENEAYDSKKKEKEIGGRTTAVDSRRRERLVKEKMRLGVGGGRAQFRVIFRADFPSCAVQPGNDTVVGAHFGSAGRGPKMDPRRVSRLVERTAVGEGERDGVSKG